MPSVRERFSSSKSASPSNRTHIVVVGVVIAIFGALDFSSERPISSTCSVFGDRWRRCGGSWQLLGGMQRWEGARCLARLVVVEGVFVRETGRPSSLGTIAVAPANRRRRQAREK